MTLNNTCRIASKTVDLYGWVRRIVAMATITDIVKEMTPALEQLAAYLDVSMQSEASNFFSQVQQLLGNVENEEELLELFIMLSMMAFQGFQLDPTATMMADQILAHAERVSHAFSADSGNVH